MGIEYFKCYHSYLNKIAKLSDQEVGRLFRALLIYSATGERQELTGREDIAFDFIADDIDRAKQSYERKCNINATNGSKGGRPKKQIGADGKSEKSERFLENQTVISKTEKSQGKGKGKEKEETNKEKEPPKGGSKEKRKRFTAPSVTEVQEYCDQRGNSVNAEQFVDFYQANGWTQGRGKPIVDWKACVRTWEKRDSRSQPRNRFQNYEQRNIDYDSIVDEITKGQYE